MTHDICPYCRGECLDPETHSVKSWGSKCPECKGTGIDPKHSRKQRMEEGSNRYTAGHDEEPPCNRCGGTGEYEPQA